MSPRESAFPTLFPHPPPLVCPSTAELDSISFLPDFACGAVSSISLFPPLVVVVSLFPPRPSFL